MAKKKPAVKANANKPAIFVQKEVDGSYRLMVRSLAGETYAGTRLARGPALPVWQFSGLTKEQADESARELQQYINANH